MCKNNSNKECFTEIHKETEVKIIETENDFGTKFKLERTICKKCGIPLGDTFLRFL